MKRETILFGSRISGLFRLIRFELPLTAGTCVILGELLALGGLPPLKELAFGFLSVFFISATSLILNDYFDIESDRINAPERPLPSGQVTKRDVLLFSSLITTLGFITSAILGFKALLVVLFVWVMGFLYNWRYKKSGLAGNLMVCFSVGMTFIYGGLVVGRPLEKTVWLFGIMAMLINLGEEIAADAMDVDGDRQAGSRSLPVVLGQENAMKVSGAIFFFASVVSSLPFLFGWMDWIFAAPILLMDGVILFSTVKLLDARTTNRRGTIRLIYLSALAAITIVIAMRILW